ncbi:MAG: pyridoxamine 5'-phosphate oxidase family protein [Gordonia sp. (in: high G+C Gram-positive bacteria)]
MITSGDGFGVDCDAEARTSIDPLRLLSMWVPPAGTSAPLLMGLSTIGQDGYPRLRHVLLSEFADGAVYFHTDSRSAKVAEIAANPRAAVSFAWPGLGKQFTLHGDVSRADPAEETSVYQRRGRYLQLLAWLNTTDMAHLSESERHTAWAQFDAAHPILTPPAEWVGYRIVPKSITFWRGDPIGPSQRVRFTAGTDGWSCEVLPG